MYNYEILIIISSNVEETIKKISNLINKNCNITSIEKIGQKKLAYPVKKHTEGYFVSIDFCGEEKFAKELEQEARNINEVIKHIVVKK